MHRLPITLTVSALAALCLLNPYPANALTPLTPKLTPESHAELVAQLTELGFPSVGHNSVVIALTQTLGFKAESKTYDYNEPYAHLPRVQVQASPDGAGCASVALHATYQQPRPGGVRLRATYCLRGVAEWQAKEQRLIADP